MTQTAPAAAGLPTDPLVARLRAEAADGVGGGLALIFGGLGVSVVMVTMFVLLLDFIVGLPGLTYTLWIAIFGVIFAALAFAWLRLRAGFFAPTAFEYVDPRQEWLGVGRFGGGAGGMAAMAADGLFFGPRMLMAGVHQTADREPPSRERFFDRCALLLRQLAKAGEAVKTDSVSIGEDETADKLTPVLNYLDRAGWVGLSSDRSRLWLSTKAKTELTAIGITVGVPEAK